MKLRGFAQGLYDISATKKEALGTLRVTHDGRAFRYAKAGASALAPGKLGCAAAGVAAHLDEAILAAVTVGTKILAVTVTAGTAIAENALAGGYFAINDNTGEGQSLVIQSNSAISASGTVVNITLEEGLRVALDATSEFNLIPSPWAAVVETTTKAAPVGITPVAVTAAYYYWAQTKGVHGAVLMNGTPAVGDAVCQGVTTAGSVDVMAGAGTITQVGTVFGVAGVSTEYQSVMLSID